MGVGVDVGMTVEQAAINAGDCYVLTNRYLAVANTTAVALEIKTPANMDVHLEIYCGFLDAGIGTIELIEAPSLTTGVTSSVPKNRNRQSAKASACVCKIDPTAIAGGTTLETYNFGGSGGQGSVFSTGITPVFKYVLARNTTYILRVTNNSGAATNISLFTAWVERLIQ